MCREGRLGGEGEGEDEMEPAPLFRLQPGVSPSSEGIACAKLAGKRVCMTRGVGTAHRFCIHVRAKLYYLCGHGYGHGYGQV